MRGNKIWNLQFLKLIKVVGCSLAGIVACGGILWIVLSDESSEERVEDRPLVSIPNREPEPQVLNLLNPIMLRKESKFWKEQLEQSIRDKKTLAADVMLS